MPRTGRVTTTATSPSSLLATSARILRTSLLRLTSPPPRLHRLSFPPLTPSVLALPSTSPCSTMRSSTPPIRLATWPSRLSMMLLPVRCDSDDSLLEWNLTKEFAELDTLSEESYKDSTLIMQLLRDNLVSWAYFWRPRISANPYRRLSGPRLRRSRLLLRRRLPPRSPRPMRRRRRSPRRSERRDNRDNLVDLGKPGGNGVLGVRLEIPQVTLHVLRKYTELSPCWRLMAKRAREQCIWRVSFSDGLPFRLFTHLKIVWTIKTKKTSFSVKLAVLVLRFPTWRVTCDS